MGRALGEASDLNEFFSALPPLVDRLVARTASFCNERSGHFDGFDQVGWRTGHVSCKA